MRSDYEERREARIERLRDRAAKTRAESEAASGRAHEIMDRIPFGQPILIGHHSENMARRDTEKTHSLIGKSVKASEKASQLESRAAAAESNSAISSDDPNALDKLREKLAGLEEFQKEMLNINKAYRKGKTTEEKAALIFALGDMKEETVLKIIANGGIPSWQTSNNSANIRAVKKRIEKLELLNSKENKEYEINGVRVCENATENRVQLYFNGKPDEPTREALKRHGFRWAPSVGAWQTNYSSFAVHKAKRILEGVGEVIINENLHSGRD